MTTMAAEAESTPILQRPATPAWRRVAPVCAVLSSALALVAATGRVPRGAPVAVEALDRLAPSVAADVDALCGAFLDPRIDYSACSDKEDLGFGKTDYSLQAAAYPKATACAASDGADGFLWYRPCQWQAIAALPELCAGRFEPVAPSPSEDAVISVKRKDVIAQMEDLGVFGDNTTPCQANAFCSSCYADDGSTNPYCDAVLDQHPGLLKSSVYIQNPDTFFGELDYWCSDDVLRAVAEGDDLPPLRDLYERGAVLVPGGADEAKTEKAPFGR